LADNFIFFAPRHTPMTIILKIQMLLYLSQLLQRIQDSHSNNPIDHLELFPPPGTNLIFYRPRVH
jgi:hypothetical protein